MHTRYNAVVTGLTVEVWQSVWGEEEIGGLKMRSKKLIITFVEKFNEHYDSGLYTLK